MIIETQILIFVNNELHKLDQTELLRTVTVNKLVFLEQFFDQRIKVDWNSQSFQLKFSTEFLELNFNLNIAKFAVRISLRRIEFTNWNKVSWFSTWFVNHWLAATVLRTLFYELWSSCYELYKKATYHFHFQHPTKPHF